MGVVIWYRRGQINATHHLVCLLLGSNIEPEKNIPQAITLLAEKLTILKVSSAYASASVDCCYPDYLNLAVSVTTSLDADALKELVLRPLEAQMGRVRTEDRNASRPIDLDIIIFDGVLMDPLLWQHAHRAVPIAELFPDYRSPAGVLLIDVARHLAQITPVRPRGDIPIPLP
jgi:2-amino-4-hydroxy-6-hydroxymethyldihydropteridine diphosphokinase